METVGDPVVLNVLGDPMCALWFCMHEDPVCIVTPTVWTLGSLRTLLAPQALWVLQDHLSKWLSQPLHLPPPSSQAGLHRNVNVSC